MRLLLAKREEESLTVYTDGFRAYHPLEEDENFQREAVIHGDSKYVDGRRTREHLRGVSKDKLTPYRRAFQLRRRILRKPGQEALKEVVRTVL